MVGQTVKSYRVQENIQRLKNVRLGFSFLAHVLFSWVSGISLGALKWKGGASSQNDQAYEPSLWSSWCIIHQLTHPRSWPMQVCMKLERMPLNNIKAMSCQTIQAQFRPSQSDNQVHDQKSAVRSGMQGWIQQQKQQLVVAAASAFFHIIDTIVNFRTPPQFSGGGAT